MSTTKLREASPRLQDRYGYRRTPTSAWVAATIALVLIAGFGVWAADRIGNPPVTANLLAWSAEPTHTEVSWEIHRNPSEATECAVRVQNYYHHDVGYAIVTIPAGTSYEQETYDVATNGEGFATELLGCAPVGELIVTSPDFPPGTTNPSQPWRKS